MVVEDLVNKNHWIVFKEHLKSWKWALVPLLYFFIDQYQGHWEVNSSERLDFYFIGMASWKLITVIFIVMDFKLLMNGTSLFLFVTLLTWLIYELIDEIRTSGDRIENDMVLMYCLYVFAFLVLGTIFSAIVVVIKDRLEQA